MYDIISFGASTVDILVKSEQLVQKNGILGLPVSSKNEISQSLICSGGGGSNSSVAFSRLGLKTACVSLLGSDTLSRYVMSDFATEKVDTSLLSRPPDELTDFSVILVAHDGSRSIMTYRGKNRLEEKHLAWSKIEKTKWFYIASLEGNLDLLEKLIGFAFDHKIKVALNPGNRELSKKRQIIPLLKYIDFFLLNKTESENLMDSQNDDSGFWSKVAALKSLITAVTNGRQGAHVFTCGQHLFSPIINIKPVDETGAGDSFGSAFVAALIYGKDPGEALSWGIKNSASVVSAMGAKTALLTLKQIK
ncbi:MAG: carbohydrate kinase family protein [Candidatus Shapirobacteria bacterium]|jgi:sugar/nucleoside kinase (ribokinase family)